MNQKNEEPDAVMRIYAPDLKKMKNWPPPGTEIVNQKGPLKGI